MKWSASTLGIFVAADADSLNHVLRKHKTLAPVYGSLRLLKAKSYGENNTEENKRLTTEKKCIINKEHKPKGPFSKAIKKANILYNFLFIRLHVIITTIVFGPILFLSPSSLSVFSFLLLFMLLLLLLFIIGVVVLLVMKIYLDCIFDYSKSGW